MRFDPAQHKIVAVDRKTGEHHHFELPEIAAAGVPMTGPDLGPVLQRLAAVETGRTDPGLAQRVSDLETKLATMLAVFERHAGGGQ